MASKFGNIKIAADVVFSPKFDSGVFLMQTYQPYAVR